MGTRLEFNEALLNLVPHAYYQPPATVRMEYPCIVYDLSKIDSKYADNMSYARRRAYLLTLITRLPADSELDDIMDAFSYIRFDRHYTADNLHHYTFELYY